MWDSQQCRIMGQGDRVGPRWTKCGNIDADDKNSSRQVSRNEHKQKTIYLSHDND